MLPRRDPVGGSWTCVARTIADLDGASQIRRAHMVEALSFRRIAPERR